MTDAFPEFIRALPRPDSPFPIDARIVPSEHVLTMFYEVGEQLDIPEHTHGPQWGVVLEGSMEMTVGDETRTYARGDTFYIPNDVPHTAHIHRGYRGIDVFSDPNRYRPLEREPDPEGVP